jgi:hypothetical protein
LKKQREYEDEVNEATKAKEVTAYEDSWYRSLKALADMRPTETDVRPAEEEKAPAEDDVHPAGEVDEAPADEDVYPVTDGSHHAADDIRPVEGDEETGGIPED